MRYNMDVPQNPHARQSESDTEGDVLYDSIYGNGSQDMSPRDKKEVSDWQG